MTLPIDASWQDPGGMTWTLAPDLRFDCCCCTACCRGWSIPVEEHWAAQLEVERLRSASARLAGRELIVVGQTAEGEAIRFLAADGHRCIFLEPDGMCLIHRVLGFAAKPEGCRRFPFRIFLRAAATGMVSLRLACPGYVRSWRTGTLVREQLPGLLATLGPEEESEAGELRIGPGAFLPAPDEAAWQQRLLAVVDEADGPLAALRQLAALLGTLAEERSAAPSTGLAARLAAWLTSLLEAEVAADEPEDCGLHVEKPLLDVGLHAIRFLLEECSPRQVEQALLLGEDDLEQTPEIRAYLVDLLGRFIRNRDFQHVPDLQVAFGMCALLVRLLVWGLLRQAPAIRLNWVASGAARLFRSACWLGIGRTPVVDEALRQVCRLSSQTHFRQTLLPWDGDTGSCTG